MTFVWLFLTILCYCFTSINAKRARSMHRRAIPSSLMERQSDATVYYFNQLIDHNNPELGTFSQRFYFNSEYYKPGGPIMLISGGEQPIDGLYGTITNSTMYGKIAQQQNGSLFLLEHRYYGNSNPYPYLNATSFEVHTVPQAIEDLVYFAKNADLPMTGGDNVEPGSANPWIIAGSSYSGALAAWTMQSNPGVFWAGYASSAPVEAVENFYKYYAPISQNMPVNCSSDVQAVITNIDSIFASGNQTAIQEILELFGMEALWPNLDDFEDALRSDIQDWGSDLFDQFCDALEVNNGVIAGASGWGYQHALNAWANWWTTFYYEYECGDLDPVSCLGSHNATNPLFTDTETGNWYHSWQWSLCKWFGWSEGAPYPGTTAPRLIGSLLQPSYAERLCTYEFPTVFPTITHPNTTAINGAYGGWDISLNRAFFSAGKRDPWRYVTLLSPDHPRLSTPSQPLYLHDGFHTGDVYVENSNNDLSIAATQKALLSYMAKWLSEYPA